MSWASTWTVIPNAIVVPERIDLNAWKQLFAANPAPPANGKIIVLCVCRFYPRKRVNVLLKALAAARIPELEIVTWMGDTSQAELASEYNRADVFCMPSVQEGFGIVFLEAMAAGKPIVAVRAAATPEVVTEGILVNPDDPPTTCRSSSHAASECQPDSAVLEG